MKKIVVFSPLPPEKNGIGDYVSELLPYLAKKYHVTVVVDDTAFIPPSALDEIGIIRISTYLKYQSYFTDCVHMYQVGNNAGHRYMLPVLFNVPGIVVLHDIHTDYLMRLAAETEENMAAGIFRLYGQLGLDAFPDSTWRLPKNRHILESAQAIIVHSDYARDMVLKNAPETQVHVIPHHIPPKVDTLNPHSRSDARDRLGLPEQELIIVSLGFASYQKRIGDVLDALQSVKSKLPIFSYVIAGTLSDDVRDKIASSKLGRSLKTTGYISEDEFFDYILAADIITNLRAPYKGETSGPLNRSLGIGRCCIVNDVGAFGELPDTVVEKIPATDFHTSLCQSILDLGQNAARRRDYEIAAREFADTQMSIHKTSGLYSDVIEGIDTHAQSLESVDSYYSLGQKLVSFLPKQEFERAIQSNLDLLENVSISPDAGYLWWAENQCPLLRNNEEISLIGGSHLICNVLQNVFNATNVSLFSPLTGEVPKAQSIQNSLVVVPYDLIAQDPMTLFVEINRLLMDGGVCTLNLTGMFEGQKDALLTDWLQKTKQDSSCFWQSLAAYAGFEVLAYRDCAEDSFSSMLSRRIQDSIASREKGEICMRLRKMSRMIDRKPRKLYGGSLSAPFLMNSEFEPLLSLYSRG